jgi:ssDNA-binding Zn-finger/Zn-ribbon topoisomerase 1
MVMRAGRYGEYLACANYPEHKETRPIARPEEALDPNAPPPAELPGVGEPCPECGPTAGGTLVAKRGRFGPFVGCARYPDCKYIKKDGPPPPDQLPFEVTCPTCGLGHLTARRARRTGSVFWGCSRYPKCDFTTSREPVGADHDVDGGPIVRNTEPAKPDEAPAEGSADLAPAGDPPNTSKPAAVSAGRLTEAASPRAGATSGLCLKCGATVPLPAGDLVGRTLAGGPADPTALRRPGRGGRPAGRARAGGARSGRTPTRSSRSTRARGSATTGSAPGA